MIAERFDADSATLRLSRDELAIIHAALNEVGNGSDIADFEFPTRVGYERDQVRGLLDQIHYLVSEQWK
jgi:hypothetical protein